ncbi:hypothetical protein [Myroides pelagicus]|uniref:EF-hand domain-containing protein n=1 Tax=Myroides pelagicus TaxID=270914 RepID=A0A7K1GJ50_9FLAO|nr:hypothetical protein [Myroides pelagicus]MTH28828.1 hypothetical protein [Myroides pelagicus]
MKELRFLMCLFSLLIGGVIMAQKTTIQAVNYGISDNLDIQAVASIFGQSTDLADFEYRLNDPNARISNLDLNNDGYVDYLRVVEVVEDYTHLIIVQAVLGRDLYQDVLTIEIEKDNRRGTTYIQFVGNPFFYGPNYIYEPVYYTQPPLFSIFWSSSYRPYYSGWSWGYYPSYYYSYSPYPTQRYVTHVHAHINVNNNYFYHPYRYSYRAESMYANNRTTYYEKSNPSRDFRTTYKEAGYTNQRDLNYSRGNIYSNNSSYSRSNYSRGDSGTSSSNSSYSRSNYSRGDSGTSSNNSSYSRSNYSRSNSGTSSNNSGYSRSNYSRGNSGTNSNNSSYSRSNYSRGNSNSSSRSGSTTYSR